MAQKDKVKELVGRGLNSYHTKALQQIHRIEKKNKEQNHKISILSNELDNDYLTKTEEGSVVSLEHSKEGMVYLDELQGNTLVNYCTDGYKEMTLNGDIDVEGTFVTTTEGVDNGKVDVMCEGNTEKVTNSNMICWLDSSNYVNGTISDNTKNNNYANVQGNIEYGDSGILADKISIPNITTLPTSFTIDIRTSLHELETESIIAKRTSVSNGFFVFYYQGKLCYDFNGSNNRHQTNIGLQPNRLYRITFVVDNNKSKLYLDGNLIHEATHSFTYVDVEKSIDVLYDSSNASYIREGKLVELKVYNKALTREEILLDEGYKLQSVGQDDENGHKIEILSQNKNLYNESEHLYKCSISVEDYKWGFSNVGNRRSIKIPCKPNTTYTFSKVGGDRLLICSHNEDFDVDAKDVYMKYCYYNSQRSQHIQKYTFTTHSDSKVLCIYVSLDTLATDIQLEESPNKTDYVKCNINKKEILLNEPLRGIPSGVKDKKVKIGNKWYIERNYKEVILNGNEDWTLEFDKTNTIAFYTFDLLGKTNFDENIICDKFTVASERLSSYDLECVRNASGFYININKSRLSTQDLIGFKQWLTTNNVRVVYQLATPIYEPLEIEPTLNTYNDITHISNNSIIPCNMKIQNSGYNAIIKPSTLYTIALDTNKSGTIGMNLGGAKGTTTNNVLNLTTPATLADNSLRLYGKGIKASKVRLLEGDKTNWIPSHFDGMKSSFEDKLQDDGSYKMEILSNNRNLLYIDNTKNLSYCTYSDGEYTSKFGQTSFAWSRVDCSKSYTLPKGIYYFSAKIKLNNNISTNFNKILPHINGDLPKNLTYTNTVSGSLTNDYKTYETKIVANVPFTFNKVFLQIGNAADVAEIKFKDLMISTYSMIEYEKSNMNKIQFSSIEPLRSVEDTKDKFVFKDGKLMIERNCKKIIVDNELSWVGFDTSVTPNHPRAYFLLDDYKLNKRSHCDGFGFVNADKEFRHFKAHPFAPEDVKTIVWFYVEKAKLNTYNQQGFVEYFKDNTFTLVYPTKEPTYEEISPELQKLILEGYEDGTLFFDTNIPPTSTVTYAGETPIVKSVKLNKTEVLNNTNDINDNIIPYLMDMDYRVVCLQLQSEEFNGGVSMARLFGGAYEMLKRDILSKRLSRQEYGYRLADYFNAGKLTEEQVRELEDLR